MPFQPDDNKVSKNKIQSKYFFLCELLSSSEQVFAKKKNYVTLLILNEIISLFLRGSSRLPGR